MHAEVYLHLVVTDCCWTLPSANRLGDLKKLFRTNHERKSTNPVPDLGST